MHATEFLSQKSIPSVPPLVVLVGAERYFKQQVQQALLRTLFPGVENPAEAATQLEGRDADWRYVLDELKTISMFGGLRCVCIAAADDFVTAHRAGLEKYADKPASRSVLLLDVKSWPKTTKLAKKFQSGGLTVECTELKGAQLAGWVISHAQVAYQKSVSRPVAQILIDLAGTSVGLLDQELDKVSAFAGERRELRAEDVQAVVGGWRLETTWAMINAVRDGRLDVALTEMNKLVTSGEAPQKLLGGISFVYRKLTAAIRAAGPTKPLGVALREAGVFPNELAATESYLRKLGRQRAEQIPGLLLRADLGMKGESSLPPRLLLEQLLVQLSGIK